MIGAHPLGARPLGAADGPATGTGIRVIVGGRDLSDYFVPGSLSIKSETNSRTTASLSLADRTGAAARSFTIQCGDSATILSDVGPLFSGIVWEFPELVPGHTTSPAVLYDVRLVSFAAFCDRRYVVDEWTDPEEYEVTQTAGDIVRELWAEYLQSEGIVLGTIEDGPLVQTFKAAWLSVSQCLDRLAGLGGLGAYCWFVDQSRQLHFRSRATFAAPISIAPGSDPIRNLTIRRSLAGYRNRQIVIGGESPVEEQTEIFLADGTENSFETLLPLAEKPTISVDGTPVDEDDIGLKGDALTPWLYEVGSERIERARDFRIAGSRSWDPGTIPAGENEVLDVQALGSVPTDVVDVQFDPADSDEDLLVSGWVLEAGIVRVRIRNIGASASAPGLGTVRVAAWREKQTVAPVPAGSTVAITYRGLAPVVIVAEDDESRLERQAVEGGLAIYEARRTEESLTTLESVRKAAEAELEAHATIPIELSFETDDGRLRAGQIMAVEVSEHSLDTSFYLESVSIRDIGSDGRLRATVRASDGARVAERMRFYRDLLLGAKPFELAQGARVVLASKARDDLEISDTATDYASDQVSPWADDDFTVWRVGAPARLARQITIGEETRAVGPRIGAPEHV